MSNQVLGFDAYHGDQIASFHDAYSSGRRFCYLKATQGVDVADPQYKSYYARAASTGLLVGAYHYFVPTDDPVTQANHFMAVSAPAKGDLFPALDVEVASDNVGVAARTCADRIKVICGHNPLIYASSSFFGQYLAPHFPEFTLWIARYSGTLTEPPVLPTGTVIWQYSESVAMPGADNPVDGDAFFGTIDDLQQYVI